MDARNGFIGAKADLIFVRKMNPLPLQDQRHIMVSTHQQFDGCKIAGWTEHPQLFSRVCVSGLEIC